MTKSRKNCQLVAGDIVCGKYRVTKKIGTGSCCTVWKVSDIITGDIYAAKIFQCIDEDSIRYFENELKIMRCLRDKVQSSAVIKYYDHSCHVELTGGKREHSDGSRDDAESRKTYGKIRAKFFPTLIFENLHCSIFRSLDDRRFSAEECKKIFSQLLSALEYIHKCGIIHADIGVHNVLLRNPETLEIAVIDFDSASIGNKLFIDKPGVVYYRSPEIIIDDSYNDKTDIWSAGCFLYEILTGKLLFDTEKNKLLRDIEESDDSYSEEDSYCSRDDYSHDDYSHDDNHSSHATSEEDNDCSRGEYSHDGCPHNGKQEVSSDDTRDDDETARSLDYITQSDANDEESRVSTDDESAHSENTQSEHATQHDETASDHQSETDESVSDEPDNSSEYSPTDESDSSDSYNSSMYEGSWETDYKHLLLIQSYIGKPPDEIVSTGREYYNRKGKLKYNPPVHYTPLHTMLTDNGVSADNAEYFENILLKCLRWRADDRYSAEKLREYIAD